MSQLEVIYLPNKLHKQYQKLAEIADMQVAEVIVDILDKYIKNKLK